MHPAWRGLSLPRTGTALSDVPSESALTRCHTRMQPGAYHVQLTTGLQSVGGTPNAVAFFRT
ncbi:hypothetical protein RSK60_1670001 [Ralstonia solanacearum K60]|nr:hypothetical protein RSK60_1670001 [Ralstonia solanacearum K60]